MAHRGSYKTTGITEIGAIWWLLFHPQDRIAIIRKPYTEAAKTLWTIKQYFKQQVIKDLFFAVHGEEPKMTVSKENKIVFSFKKTVTKEGSIDCYSIDGSYTGNHYDKILCDDIIILKDRVSKAERESTKEGVRELLTNIIDPGKQCMFVGTPWHKDDAWVVCPKPITFNWQQTRILTQEEIDEKRSRTTSTLFGINYDLKHMSDEDAIFKDPIYGNWKPNTRRVYGHLDAKYGGSHTGALTFAAKLGSQVQIIGFSFTENVKQKVDWIKELYKRFRCEEIFMEENPDKGYTKDLLRENGMVATGYHEGTNKHIKIVAHLKGRWPDLIWAKNTDPEYMNQVLDYVEGEEPDDAPDSAASLIRQKFKTFDAFDILSGD